MSKGGKLQARRIAAYQLSDLLADQVNVHFSEEFLKFGLRFDLSRRLPPPQMTILSKGIGQETEVKMVLHAKSLLGGIFSG